MTAVFLIMGFAVLAVCVTAKLAADQRRQREPRPKRKSAVESRRDAYYMKNFWNYDGSEQEEFDE